MEHTRMDLAIRTPVAAVHSLPSAGPTPRPARPRSLPERHSVRAQILGALRNALAAGQLTPGEVYSAPALAERYGVSATPVREAMQQLAGEGVVEVVPNRGFRVASHSSRDAAELAEVRAALEIPVIMQLARRLPVERWAALRPEAEATVTAARLGDRIAYAEADRSFHRVLLQLAGNRQLVTVAQDLHRRAQCQAIHGPLPDAAGLLADALQHVALLDALGCHDLEAAERLAGEHFSPVPESGGYGEHRPFARGLAPPARRSAG